MKNSNKIDLLIAFVIGEIAAWFLVIIIGNLAIENPSLAVALPLTAFLPIIFPALCVLGMFIARLLTSAIPIIYQFAKFVLVGGLNFLIDMGVLNLLVFYTGIATGFTQTGFKAFSFLFAVINSYFWNKYWVFKSRKSEKVGKEFLQFMIISIVGFFINLGVNYIFVNTVGAMGAIPVKTWAQISAMIAAAVALFWNFFGYKTIVFKPNT